MIELKQHFNDNQDQKMAIDSIMDNRHKIAHGKHSAISVAQAGQSHYIKKIF